MEIMVPTRTFSFLPRLFASYADGSLELAIGRYGVLFGRFEGRWFFLRSW